MLCLVRSKGCKRCGGDLSLECDIYGVYAECIQCGANWSEEEMIIHTTEEAVESTEVRKERRSAIARHGH